LINTTAAYRVYAEYLVKAAEVVEQRGLPLAYMSLQNEPYTPPGGGAIYPGMRMEPAEQVQLGALVRERLPRSIKLLAWDHNWDHTEFPLEVLKDSEAGTFAGVAWHCYSGTMEQAYQKLQQAYPSLETHMTECVALFANGACDVSTGMRDFAVNHQWDMMNVFAGAAAHGAQSGIKYALVADETCGPVLPELHYWKRAIRPLVTIPSDARSMDDLIFQQDFWTMAHSGAQFIEPGAKRVAVTTSSGFPGFVEAFHNKRAKTVTLIALNWHKEEEVSAIVWHKGQPVSLTVPPRGTVIFQVLR